MHGFSKIKPAPGSNAIQDYMERQLTALHYASAPSVNNTKSKLIVFFIALVLLSLLPYIHIGIFYMLIWTPDKAPIDRYGCTCSCFDTIFRGRYEQPGPVMYKHVYFNATPQTLKIWIVTVFFLLAAYESIKYLFSLFCQRQVRWTMFFLYLVNIYPHYYSWWCYFNYYNEDFYEYFRHHLYFVFTELIVTFFVLNLCDRRNSIVSWKIFLIMAISLIHILVSSLDQFINHVIHARGTTFQNVRNIALMVPDMLHVALPAFVLLRTAREKHIPIIELCYKEEVGLFFLTVFLGTLAGKII